MTIAANVTRYVRDSHVVTSSVTFDPMFCEWYDKRVGKQWTSYSPVTKWLESEKRIKTVKPKGKYVIFPVELSLGGGVGALGEGDAYPTADKMTTLQGKVDYQKGFKGQMQISEEAMAWGSNEGTLADVFEQEVTNVENGIRNLAAIYAWGDGTGIVAKTTTQVTADAFIVPVCSETSSYILPGTRHLYEGMKLGCIATLATNTDDASWTETTTTHQITSIESDVKAYLGAVNDTAQATAYFLPVNSYTSGTAVTQRGPMGLSGIVDDGTMSDTAPNSTSFGCCGILASTYPQWKSLISSNSGTARALTTDLFYQLYWKIARRNGDLAHKPVAWMNTDVHRELVALLEPQVQFQPTKLEPGFEEMSIVINGTNIPIKLDQRCPSFVYFINPNYITFYNSRPLGIVKYGGQAEIPDATYGASKYHYWWAWQLATNKRNAHGAIKDISCTITSV